METIKEHIETEEIADTEDGHGHVIYEDPCD